MEDSRKNDIVIKKANDHWAFLEHIEAPMWADLTLEANSGGEDIGDDWFNTSHPFHQLSARHLKSKFSHTGDEMLTSVVNSKGLDSPQLPSSVSRSRGKHYNVKKWGGMNLNILLDKQQGLSKRFLQAGSSFGQEVKPKPKSNNISKPKGPLNAKSNARVNAKSMSSCSNQMSRSSFVGNKSGESYTSSTITYENAQQQKKYSEVSSKPCDKKNRNLSERSVGLRKSCITNKATGFQKPQKFMVSSQLSDQKSGISSVGSVSIGKSCVTKAASRVETGSDGMPPKGRKSSPRNSSIGSSSIPGYEVKVVSKHLRERLSNGNNVVAVNLANKNKRKPTSVSKVSVTLVEGAKSSKTKGKENVAKNVILNSKSTEREVSHGATFKNHRIKGCSLLQKDDKARSAASTKLGKDKDQCEEKNPTNLARRIYLR